MKQIKFNSKESVGAYRMLFIQEDDDNYCFSISPDFMGLVNCYNKEFTTLEEGYKKHIIDLIEFLQKELENDCTQ